MPSAQCFATKQTRKTEAHEQERKNESGSSPGVHELASNSEVEVPESAEEAPSHNREYQCVRVEYDSTGED